MHYQYVILFGDFVLFYLFLILFGAVNYFHPLAVNGYKKGAIESVDMDRRLLKTYA